MGKRVARNGTYKYICKCLQICTGRMISKDKTLLGRNDYLKTITMDVFCDISFDMDTSFLKQD